MNCRKCSFVNPDSARFCSNCGALLMQISDTSEKSLAERRQLTVLFSDMIDSTPLSERLDPEDLREIIRNYQDACTSAIFLYEGYLANFLGDGVLAYFGYPSAHEDDARRAVRAGLNIVESIQSISQRTQEKFGIALQVRVGIHTGLAVVGDIDKSDTLESRLIIGQTPNLAARIQSTAKPDTVHVSGNTYNLIRGYFESTELGAHQLKGISQAVPVYRINCASTVTSRLEINHGQLIPFVGREPELALLHQKWRDVQTGKGQIVLLSGEAGVGKSRLQHALKDYVLATSESWVIELRNSPYHRSSAFYPVIDFLERTVFRFEKNESPDEKLTRIEEFLVQYQTDLAESVPLIALLLSIPLNTRYDPPALTPQRQKQKTIELLSVIFLQRAKRQPVLFIVEDLHWSDPSSLEFIEHLMAHCNDYTILVLLIYRSKFKPAWHARDNMSAIELAGLSQANAAEIIRCISNTKELPREAIEHIIEKTDGVPLFLEELTKSMIESGMLISRDNRYELSAPIHTLGIPATIQDSLTARLDRFPQAKQIAQLASVIGREFSFDILQSIPGAHCQNLRTYLATLVQAGILFENGSQSNTLYSFRHALIQDTAYSSLLKSARKSYHKLIAESIEKTSLHIVETQPELLAQHYTKADETEKAIQYWLTAGLRALQHSANVESISHLKQGLELVKSVQDNSQRTSFEVQLYSTIGPALIATRGFGDTEVGQTYQKLGKLSQHVSNDLHLNVALWGQWVYSLVRGDLTKAHALSLEMKKTGQQSNNMAIQIEGHWTLGDTLFWLADFNAANRELEKAIESYDPEQHHIHAYIHGQDPCVAAHCYRSCNYWHMGYPDKAHAENKAAIDLAHTLRHPFSIGWSLAFAFMVRMFGNEYQEAKEWSEHTIAYCSEQAYPFWLNAAAIVHGWSVSLLGEPESGLPAIEQGLADWDLIGSVIVRPMFMGLYAEALGVAGQTGKALNIADEAIALTRKHSEIASELDLHRIKGELLKKIGQLTEAETSFRLGIARSHTYHSPARKLQAATGLYQLLKDSDKRQEAAKILQDCLAVFSEGSDRIMIKKAKALIDQ